MCELTVWCAGAGNVFQVIPEEREIQAGRTVSFTIAFRPVSTLHPISCMQLTLVVMVTFDVHLQHKPSQFYSNELECFVFYKSLRDYRQIDDYAITPPWCVTVKGFGHTFPPGTETFLPKVAVENRNIVSVQIHISLGYRYISYTYT